MIGEAEIIFLGLIIKPLLIGAVAGIVLAACYSLQAGEKTYREKLRLNLLPALGYSIPIILVAYVAGYLTGISRSAAVGTVVPAVLALMGGLNIYFFGVEAKNRNLVGYCVFVFALMFFYGVWGGVIDREVGRVGRFINLAEQERTIRTYRENRDLPPEPPAWILGGDTK